MFNQNMHVLQRRPVPGFMGPGGRVRLGFGAQIAANISKERRRGIPYRFVFARSHKLRLDPFRLE